MKYKLKEICTVITDGSHWSPQACDDGYPMFSVKDMLEYGFSYENCKRISIADFEKMKSSGCVPQKGDVLIAKDGSYLKEIFVCDETREEAILSSIAIFRPNQRIVTPEYLCYLLKSPKVYNYIKDNCVSGSAVPRIVLKTFKEVEMDVPDLVTQKKRCSILLSIDRKIQTNSKINGNLLDQAKTIFKESFIDNDSVFEWPAVPLKQLVDSTLGGDWGKDSATGNFTTEVYCIRGADIPDVKNGNKGKMPIRFILPKNYQTKALVDGDVVIEISGGSPTQSTGRATVIPQALLDRYDKGMVCTNFCRAIKPKTGLSMFFYFYWQYLYDKGVFFNYENGTTGIKNLDLNGVLSAEEIQMPPLPLIREFDDLCQTLYQQVFSNGLETERLTILRDSLLPKLMSGELDVSKLNL